MIKQDNSMLWGITNTAAGLVTLALLPTVNLIYGIGALVLLLGGIFLTIDAWDEL